MNRIILILIFFLQAQLQTAKETIQNLKLRLKERPAAPVSKPEKKKKARDASPVANSDENAPAPSKSKSGKKSSRKEVRIVLPWNLSRLSIY